MTTPSALEEMIEALRCLPGVGPKSAQRMAYHLLQRDQQGALRLSHALRHAIEVLRHCGRCNAFSESEVCERCDSPRRDASLLCVVEMPADLNMMEQTHAFNGMYYVLMGHLSPLDGIGPDQLGAREFEALLAAGGVREVILATNSTVEGEATAHLFSELVRQRGIAASRIAHGVPVGGELEYIDSGTLAHALAGRHVLG